MAKRVRRPRQGWRPRFVDWTHVPTGPVPLTPKQQRLYEYIEKRIRVDHHSPSQQEIIDALGYKYRSSACRLLDALIKRGRITMVKGRYRSIKLIEPYEIAIWPEIHPKCCSFARRMHVNVETAINELLKIYLYDEPLIEASSKRKDAKEHANERRGVDTYPPEARELPGSNGTQSQVLPANAADEGCITPCE